MYRDSPKGLRKMNYCNEVEGFINYTLSNMRNISGDNIRCSCKSCKNKNILDLDVITIHLLQKKKRFMEKYLCWFAYGEPYVPYETMVERIVGSTFSSRNVYGVADDNNNPYRNMIMDVM